MSGCIIKRLPNIVVNKDHQCSVILLLLIKIIIYCLRGNLKQSRREICSFYNWEENSGKQLFFMLHVENKDHASACSRMCCLASRVVVPLPCGLPWDITEDILKEKLTVFFFNHSSMLQEDDYLSEVNYHFRRSSQCQILNSRRVRSSIQKEECVSEFINVSGSYPGF